MTKKKDVHEVGKTERKVFTIGQSVAITLPKGFVDTHGIKAGDKVAISYDSILLLEPQERKEILSEMSKKRKDFEEEKKIDKK